MPENSFIYIPENDFISANGISVLQEKLLRAQLSYCKKHSPFYAKKLNDVDCADFRLENLRYLPFTSKSDLASSTESFMAVPRSEFEDVVFSSGTTGKPCMIGYTGQDMKRLAYNEHRCFVAAGMTKDDRVLLTCTLDRCFIAGLAYYLGTRSIGAAAIRNGLNTLESHAEVFQNLRPTILVGVPSFLRHLGTYLRENDINISSMKRLICIGEPIRDEKLDISGLGRQLEEIWGVPIHSTYASSEIVTSFCECKNTRGGHLIHDLAIAEIVDDAGNTVANGEIGELVLTQLQCTGMPLIRFRTGDMTFIDDTPCPCGRNTLRIGPILGRKAQMLKCKGTTIYPQAIFAVLQESPELIDFYLVASGENLSDQLEIVLAQKKPGAPLNALSERLRTKCRMHIPIREEAEEIVKKQIFSVSRKPVRFFDRRGKEEG